MLNLLHRPVYNRDVADDESVGIVPRAERRPYLWMWRSVLRVPCRRVEPKSGSAAGEGEYLHTTLSARSLQPVIVPAHWRRFPIILKRVPTPPRHI